jgi:C-terminal processing protease CtpA/Prc
MRRLLLALICVAAACFAQETKPDRAALRADLEPALSFEAPPSGNLPGGWNGGPAGTVFADNKIVHGGHGSVRFERDSNSTGNFSTVTKEIPIDFAGKSIELHGHLRTENVSGFVGLWMREDGDNPSLAFNNMRATQLKGTTDWTTYSIQLPLVAEATKLFFGVLVAGTGKAWADDLRLLVDGQPVWDLPQVQHVETALDSDHQFDKGSGIAVTQLSATQIDNLATLGKVWGFLKYHHPKITTGARHWDYDLFRVLPSILAAPDRAAADAALVHWIDDLGRVAPCNPCAKLNDNDLSLRPDLGWIADETTLGAELSHKLRTILENRAANRQFYVSMAPKIGNPVFNHEPGYADLKLPDFGFQLLALYRFWNIVEYWSPNRDITDEDWNRVLVDFIPRVALAKDADSYRRELMALIAKLDDGHANLWNALNARPPVGQCQIPVNVRFIENVPVITGFTVAPPDQPAELKIGDVITELDGVPAHQLVESWLPYYAGSNDAARMRDIAFFFTRGDCGDVTVGIRRQGTDLKLTVKRTAPSNIDRAKHDLPGPTFRLLSKDVAYLKLSTVKADDCPHYVEQAARAKGFVIDIRNYPSEFVVFALGSLLISTETVFVRATQGDLSNPGAFRWDAPEFLTPQKPHYSGKVVVLVDESTISSAEFTAMAFRAAGAIVVGSTTSGADGNVSHFELPGGLQTMISGLGVFYPDKKPTQRIGIVPDITLKPTIAGIRAGRDEALEQALRQILGSEVPNEEIEKIAKPQDQ